MSTPLPNEQGAQSGLFIHIVSGPGRCAHSISKQGSQTSAYRYHTSPPPRKHLLSVPYLLQAVAQLVLYSRLYYARRARVLIGLLLPFFYFPLPLKVFVYSSIIALTPLSFNLLVPMPAKFALVILGVFLSLAKLSDMYDHLNQASTFWSYTYNSFPWSIHI